MTQFFSLSSKTIWLLIFLPIGSLFCLSISQVTLGDVYSTLIGPRRLTLLMNSISIALASALVSVVIGTFTAFTLVKIRCFGGSLYRYLIILPFLVPSYLQAVVWTRLWIDFGLEDYLGFKIQSATGAVLVHSFSMFSLVAAIVMFALSKIDKNIEDAAAFSMTRRRALWQIVLPLLKPSLMVSFSIVFILVLNNFEVADSLRINTYPFEIFISYSAFYNEKEGVLLSFPLIFISMLVIGFTVTTIKKHNYFGVKLGSHSIKQYSVGHYRWLFSIAVGLILLVSFLLPFGAMFHYALPLETSKTLLISLTPCFTTLLYSAF
ncbi:ABC transporter permease [Vibrio agarivorans]|uniref:ABC transmembrane type-1 domain-containing protein n=1 Tax=Vibrio agarivorans TaxID=153622 RepID=A0ABT7Y0D9_9VIBR|nr:ABC transporter permease subunit [Vibrio agarivorans]MDN2481507.1 hypothetical protein [Vibrio agarivorans]